MATFYIIRKKKQASEIFLWLSGQARQVVSELEVGKLNDYNGVKNLLEKLDKLYLKMIHTLLMKHMKDLKHFQEHLH